MKCDVMNAMLVFGSKRTLIEVLHHLRQRLCFNLLGPGSSENDLYQFEKKIHSIQTIFNYLLGLGERNYLLCQVLCQSIIFHHVEILK